MQPHTVSSPRRRLAPQEELSIYLHWPFCRRKCPYCDFNVHVRQQQGGALDQNAWQAAFTKAINAAARQTGPRRIRSIYFGGGTPSLMPVALVASSIEEIEAHWGFGSVEVTLEANPSDVTSQSLQAWKDVGVNRISLGVQSFSDRALTALGRNHSGAEALAAAEAVAAYFSRWSLDLMTALPIEFGDPWRTDLEMALSLAPRHLSVYQLTVERSTVFEALARSGEFHPLDDDEAAKRYTETVRTLSNAGFEAYEISNFCRDRSDWSEHNSSGWRYQDYLGIGPGAHGRLTYDGQIHATRQHRAPELWLQRVLSAKLDANIDSGDSKEFETSVILSREEAASEWLMAGLRMVSGVKMSDGEKRFGFNPGQIINHAAAQQLATEGWLDLSNEEIKVTSQGRLVLNELLRRLLV